MATFDFDKALDELNINATVSNELIQEVNKESAEANVQTYSKKANEAGNILCEVKEMDRELAVKLKVIPKNYKYASFDIDKIKENIIEQNKKTYGIYTIKKFNEYSQICLGIISALRTGALPNRSYVIGAPNGFGKTSFVTECLTTMVAKGMMAVPYISLLELAEVKLAEENRLLNPYRYKKANVDQKDDGYYYIENKDLSVLKLPQDITGYYSWSEYMNAPCLFCSLSDVSSKIIESKTLYQILNIRGAKGLPTIVMASTSLDPYKKDEVLREQVWNEILDSRQDRQSYDRLYHISCYKVRKNAIADA